VRHGTRVARPGSKLATVVDLLEGEAGTAIAEIMAATGWQQHTVRGALAGSITRKLGRTLSSEKTEGRGRVQTGFDQPLLHTMYVDRRLAGIQAVQTLSRLNRIHPLKEDTFVLDFVNERDEIREAFKTYFEGAEVGEDVDPARMYEIKSELDAEGIYVVADLNRFSAVYFKPRQRQSPNDHQLMNAALDPCVARFKETQEEKPDEAELWRGKLMAFSSLYGFLSQIIPYQDTDLERLYVFLRHLATKLPKRGAGPSYQFDDEVRLEYYRLQKISEGSISLNDGQANRLDGPAAATVIGASANGRILWKLADGRCYADWEAEGTLPQGEPVANV
jgi:hypothetical protein